MKKGDHSISIMALVGNICSIDAKSMMPRCDIHFVHVYVIGNLVWYGMANSCMYLIRSVHECISPHVAQKLGLNHKATDLREFGPSLLLTPSLHIKVVKKMC